WNLECSQSAHNELLSQEMNAQARQPSDGAAQDPALIKPAGVSAGLIIFASTALLFSQSVRERSHDVKNGERIYKSGCIACHCATGQGAPETLTEFKRPDTFPDFTRCDQTTPEPNSAWQD